MLKHMLRQIETQRKPSNQHANTKNNGDTLKQNNQAIQPAWLQEHKDRLRQQLLGAI